MAAWNTLTQQQRDEITQLIVAVREWAGLTARVHNLGRAIASKYVGNTDAIVASLDAGDIPVYDAGNGEEPLSKSDLLSLVGYAIDSSSTVDGASGSYNTNYHRSLYAKAAGLWNTIQQGR